MKDQIEEGVSRLRGERLPTCPLWLEGEVMDRIHRLGGHAWREVVTLAVRPVMAAGLLALAVMLGALTTAVAGHVGGVSVAEADPLGFGIIKNPHVLECLECYHKSPGQASRGHH